MLIDAYKNGLIETKNVNAVYSPKKYNEYNMENSIMKNRTEKQFSGLQSGNTIPKRGCFQSSIPSSFLPEDRFPGASPLLFGKASDPYFILCS